jgi:hypothetical protein
VSQHDHRRQFEADGDRAQHDLHQQQAESDGRGNHDVATLAPGDPCEERRQHDQRARERGGRPMRVFDDGVQVEGRQHASVAQRPVRTAEAGSGNPNDTTEHDERVGHQRGGDAERPECLHPGL